VISFGGRSNQLLPTDSPDTTSTFRPSEKNPSLTWTFVGVPLRLSAPNLHGRAFPCPRRHEASGIVSYVPLLLDDDLRFGRVPARRRSPPPAKLEPDVRRACASYLLGCGAMRGPSRSPRRGRAPTFIRAVMRGRSFRPTSTSRPTCSVRKRRSPTMVDRRSPSSDHPSLTARGRAGNHDHRLTAPRNGSGDRSPRPGAR